MWMKKLSLTLMACLVALSFSIGGVAEAKGYKSPRKSYSPGTTTQTPGVNNGVNTNNPSVSKSPATATNPAQTANRGFFSGGGLMKGLMIGGIAGLLFGGLFGGMGFLGNVLGMLINVLAIVAVIAIIRKIYVYFRDRKKYDPNPRQQ